MSAAAQTFVCGADVSWCTEMEADGKKFYDKNGQETELMTLMRQTGMNAVRLRVWVNPEVDYGAWCDKADVLAKARRAKAAGLDVMIDFHYSDRFADPGQQYKPSAWAGLSGDALKEVVSSHTKEVLQALKDEGIEPRWVQVGNETRPGMIFDDGKLNWDKNGEATWSGYVALSNAGYDAVKQVLPEAQVIVHIDKAKDDNAWFFSAFKQYGGRFDMIGLSHYPDWAGWQNDNTNAAYQVDRLHQRFLVPIMLVETGYDAWDENRAYDVMADLFQKTEQLDGCAGIFYWEPEVYAGWKPEAYTRWGWSSYNMGAFTPQGRPSKALTPFASVAAGIDKTSMGKESRSPMMFDSLGRPTTDGRCKGIGISKGRKVNHRPHANPQPAKSSHSVRR